MNSHFIIATGRSEAVRSTVRHPDCQSEYDYYTVTVVFLGDDSAVRRLGERKRKKSGLDMYVLWADRTYIILYMRV